MKQKTRNSVRRQIKNQPTALYKILLAFQFKLIEKIHICMNDTITHCISDAIKELLIFLV